MKNRQETYKEMVKKYGKTKANKIEKLREMYQVLVCRGDAPRWTLARVDRICAYIHGMWVGVMYPLKGRQEDLILEYHALDSETQWYDFLELCWAWKRSYNTTPYPDVFVKYCERKFWYPHEMPGLDKKCSK